MTILLPVCNLQPIGVPIRDYQSPMKLLLDENLSRRIVPFIQNSYPGSTQVALVGLERAN